MSAQVQFPFKRTFSDMNDSSGDSSFSSSCGHQSQSICPSETMKRFRLSNSSHPIFSPHFYNSVFVRPNQFESFPLEKIPFLAEKVGICNSIDSVNEPSLTEKGNDTSTIAGLSEPVFQTNKKVKERKYTALEVQRLIDEAVQQREKEIREEFNATLNRVIGEHLENFAIYQSQQLHQNSHDSSYIS